MSEKESMTIGVDMGGTNMRLALVNRSGEIDGRIRLDSMANEGPDAVIARIASGVNELAGLATQEGGRVRAVGLGIPGNILPEEGLVVVSPNLTGFVNYNVHKALKKLVRFPVKIDNDANMIALGEKWLGAGKDHRNFICLTLGTGVGGGLILNGRIWHGAWGSGGEAGRHDHRSPWRPLQMREQRLPGKRGFSYGHTKEGPGWSAGRTDDLA